MSASEAVETILAPWLVPGYAPPSDASVVAKAYAKDVAEMRNAPQAPAEEAPRRGAPLSPMVLAHPCVGVQLPGKIGGHEAGRVDASSGVGVLLPEVTGGSRPDHVQGQTRVRSAAERPAEANVWQPDTSQQSATGGSLVKADDGGVVEIHVVPPEGRPTLRIAYFFSGKSRRSSVGEELKKLCTANSVGLIVHEVDILNGGADHDLLSKPK